MATRALTRFGLGAARSRKTHDAGATTTCTAQLTLTKMEGAWVPARNLSRRHSSSKPAVAAERRDFGEVGGGGLGGGDGVHVAMGADGGGGGGGAAAAPDNQLSKGSAAAEARVQRSKGEGNNAAKQPPPFASASADVARSAPVVIVQDTLEMMRGFERAGFNAEQAESIVRTILATVKSSIEPLCTRADLDKHVLLQQADLKQTQHDLTSRHREVANASKHSSDMVTSEIEKLRSEMRYMHEKVTSSQKLDLNLERGNIREELQAQDNKTAKMEIRLDREIQGMRTNIEYKYPQAAKNEVIKYSIGAVVSLLGVGMGILRLLS